VGIFISLGLGMGWAKPFTIAASVVASITMFDAATVRRAAGLQARLLNKMTRQLFKEHRFSAKPLKEMLGHTRTEVLGGMITGTCVAIIVMNIWQKMGWPNL
jgi:acid phosphatase family membrane protein YuiD